MKKDSGESMALETLDMTSKAGSASQPEDDAAAPKEKDGWEQRFKQELLSVFCVMIISSFPVLYLYFKNVQVLPFAEAVPSLFLYMLVGLVLYLPFRLLGRSASKAVLGASLGSLAFASFANIQNFAEAVFHGVYYWHVLPVVIYLICLVFYLYVKKVGTKTAGMVRNIVAMVFAALIMMNFVMAIPSYIAAGGSSGPGGESIRPEGAGTAAVQSMPNVYWLIFDEYSSLEVLDKYYDYDNTPFMEDLEDRGFNTSRKSENDSYGTSTVIGNYVQLEYVVSERMSEVEKRSYRASGPIFTMAEEHGYTVRSVGKDGFGVGLAYAMETVGSGYGTIDGESFQTVMLKNTPLAPFVTHDIQAGEEVLQAGIAYFKDPAVYSDEQAFSVLYTRCPHQPFLYDSAGNHNAPKDYNNWSDKRFYLEYLKWCNIQILEIIDSIQKNDPDSVIILQSDHSARLVADANGVVQIKDTEKRQCMNAVYYRGEEIEIEGLSGVNVLRRVMSRLYGIDMPVLDVPDYGMYRMEES